MNRAQSRTEKPGAHNLRTILDNAGWLFVDKTVRLLVGSFVLIWFTRYIGPEQFGILNYAMALVALFSVPAGMGLVDSLVVRDLVNGQDKRDEILGTCFLLRLAGGCFGMLAAIATIRLLHPDDGFLGYVVAVVAVSLTLQAFEVIDFWYQSKVQSRYAVYARMTAFLICAAAKIVFILLAMPLIAFAWLIAAEFLLTAAALCFAFQQTEKRAFFRLLRLHGERAASLLRQAWPLMLSGIGYVIYMKIDQVMLAEMIDQKEVGIYSAAVTLSEVWYFLPVILVSSLFPALIESRNQKGRQHYLFRLQQLYTLLAWSAVAIALPVTLFADRIVDLVYRHSYQQSALILQIHIWGNIFIFLRAALSKWIVLEGVLIFSLYSQTLGAVVNVLLNLLLIPAWGGAGAAAATLAAYFTTSYLACFLFPRTRCAGRMISLALFNPFAILRKGEQQ